MMNNMQKCFILALVTIGVCILPAHASNWTGSVSQDWNDLNNWNSAPSAPSGNFFVNTATGNYPIVSAPPVYTPVDIFVGSGAAGRLDQLTGTLNTGNGNWMFTGQAAGGNGTYNLANTTGTGGTFTGFAQGDGSLNVGGTLQSGVWHIGIDGTTALININTAGTVAAGEITTGNTNFANNTTFNLDNGTVNVGVFKIGGDFWGSNVASNNDFNMSGGQINSTGEIWLGGIGVGDLQMTGGVLNSNWWTVVGRNRTGTSPVFTMTGGTINAGQVGGWFVAGGFDGATGTINASGGVINSLVSGIWIGEGAKGYANLSGNVDLNGGWLNIGGNDGSVGEVSLTGSSVSVDATNLYLGLNGSGVDTTAMGTLKFIADAMGISTISLTGDVNLSSPDGDFLAVDLSAYTGSYVDIQLIDGVTSQGEFTGLAQGAAVSTNSALAYNIDYSVAGDVWLRVVPEPTSLLLALGCLGCLAIRRK